MKFSFFKALAAAFFAGKKPPSSADLAEAHARLKAEPRWQKVARTKGNARRLEAHRRCCLQGYAAKKASVNEGRGCNTLAGIPV